MVTTRSEDTAVLIGLNPETTDMALFYEALKSFFEKKSQIDSSDRYNYIIFQAEGPNHLEEYTHDFNEILEILRVEFLPNKVVIFKNSEMESEIEQKLPHLKDFKTQKNKTTAYVCEQFSCQRPTTEISLMKDQLGLSDK